MNDLSARIGHDWGDYADLIVNRAASGSCGLCGGTGYGGHSSPYRNHYCQGCSGSGRAQNQSHNLPF